MTVYEYNFPIYKAIFEFEPTNPHDPNAIKVLIRNVHVGYVKKGSTSRIKNLIEQNKIIDISAKTYGGKSKSLYTYNEDMKNTKPSDFELRINDEDIKVILTLILAE